MEAWLTRGKAQILKMPSRVDVDGSLGSRSMSGRPVFYNKRFGEIRILKFNQKLRIARSWLRSSTVGKQIIDNP